MNITYIVLHRMFGLEKDAKKCQQDLRNDGYHADYRLDPETNRYMVYFFESQNEEEARNAMAFYKKKLGVCAAWLSYPGCEKTIVS